MAIQIIGNVGNVGYAIPMVSATPLNVNAQYLLSWNPVAQALDYVPATLDLSGNMTLPGSLSVGNDLTVTDVLTVNGAAFLVNGLGVTGAIQGSAALQVGSGATAVALTPGATPEMAMGGTKVVETRKTGWVVMTGTPLRSTFATGTITLPQLAGLVMALEQDLIAHGLIGT